MNPVIKPWLIAGLITALAGSTLLSGIIIVRLGHVGDLQKQSDDLAAQTAQASTDLAALQSQHDTLQKQVDILKPSLADWQQRLEEKSAAEAAVDSLTAKQKQTESDLASASKRLDDANKGFQEAEKHKSELSSDIERLKAQLEDLTKSDIDAKATMKLAAEAERRLSDATNGLASAEARRAQLDSDVSSAKIRVDQLQKDTDSLRQIRDGLNVDIPALRLQLATLKDQIASMDQQTAELKVNKAAAQQAEQDLAAARKLLAETQASQASSAQQETDMVAQIAELKKEMAAARKDAADAQVALDGAKKAEEDLSAARKLLAETQALQEGSARQQADLVAQIADLKKQAEASRKDAAVTQVARDTAKTELQKVNDDLAGVRKLSQELSAKRDNQTREVAELQTSITQLETAKDKLLKEIGKFDAQRPNPQPTGTK